MGNNSSIRTEPRDTMTRDAMTEPRNRAQAWTVV